MFQSVLNHIKNVSSNIKTYCSGLIITIELKNISSMSREMGISRRYLEKFFEKPEERIFDIQAHQIAMVKSIATPKNKGQINIDDCMFIKTHMYKNEGVTYDRCGATKRVEKGFVAVTVAWTNGVINIQLCAEFWLNKKDAKNIQNGYIKKTTLAKKLIEWAIINEVPFEHVALDGLYNSKEFIEHLQKIGVKYVTRFHKNRKIIIKNKELRIDHHTCFFFVKNQRFKKEYGFYKGIACLFIAHKRKKKNGGYEVVFYITNISNLSAKQILAIYDKRWHIEKSYRRLKQKFGVQQCQLTSFEKQKAHLYATFFVDAIFSIKSSNGKSSIPPDEIINNIRRQKRHLFCTKNLFEFSIMA